MNYNILIIEDEEPAAKRLANMLKEAEPAFQLVQVLESVAEAVQWFQSKPKVDLIFSDIQLSDGMSFDIFKQVNPGCPVIFITAYDQYAIEAFKANGIEYLLKPLKQEELQHAITKFKQLRSPALDIQQLLASYNQTAAPVYKNRFVVRFGEHLKTISIGEIAYFYTEDKVNFLTTLEGRRYVIDYNLDHLETMINPKQFFRINRQFIISIGSIAEMLTYSKGRVNVKLKPPAKEDTIVSAERSPLFKAWLDDAG
jgi:two-component system, LytTR family, response regulator LytT